MDMQTQLIFFARQNDTVRANPESRGDPFQFAFPGELFAFS